MNKKGQSLVLFIIILPIILFLFGLLIERVYLTYQKQKLYSITKTIIALSIERNEKNDIINLYKDNNIVLENIEIDGSSGLKIIASEKVQCGNYRCNRHGRSAFYDHFREPPVV